jgi:HNH endonuclease
MEIRRLKPLVKIQLPQKERAPRRNQRRTDTIRRAADYPSPTPQPTPCRLWQGAVDNHGYGTWWRPTPKGGWRKTRPHRWIVEQFLERPLTKREHVLHLCDNRLCFRFDHLQVGTAYENNHDMMAKGRYVHSGGKLHPRTVAKIRRMYSTGLARATIALELNISEGHVRKYTSDIYRPDASHWRRPSREARTAPTESQEEGEP